MRVTLVSEEWRRNGGVGAYLRRLGAALAARGDAVQVVHADPHAVALPGVEDVFVDRLIAFDDPNPPAAATRAALEALDAFGPDVVHVHRSSNFALEAAIRARYRATKSLHVYDYCPSNTKYHHARDRECVHPTSALCLPRMGYKRCTTSRRPQVWLAMQQRASRANRNNAGYQRIIVASEHVRAQALASGYGAAQVQVVPYFVEVAPAASPEPRTIVTAGRLVREKGFDLLIDALAMVPPPWHAVIAGDGMDRASLESHARRARLSGTLEFVGWQDDAGMDGWYRRAAVVVMPSRWPEPSGIVGLEGMAHGRPVVGFAVGGIPEWLSDGVTGRLVPPGDTRGLAEALTAVLADPAAAAAMGEAGRARARAEYSAERHLSTLTGIYRSLMDHAA